MAGRKPIQDNTRKDRVFHIRLSADDATFLDQAATDTGLSKTEFVRSLIRGRHEFISVDKELLLSVYRELAAQGNNLNQIAHQLNKAAPENASALLAQRIESELARLTETDTARLSAYGAILDVLATVRQGSA